MILFLVRRFNDLDHTAPIVYRIAKGGRNELAVLALNPDFDIATDFRLAFLRERFGVKVDYVYRFYTSSVLHRVLAALACRCDRKECAPSSIDGGESAGSVALGASPAARLARRITRALQGALKSRFRQRLSKTRVFRAAFGPRWARDMLQAKQVRLMVLDWQKLGRFVTTPLVNAAKQLNIPVVGVPHGIALYTNDMWTVSAFESNTTNRFGDNWHYFDKIVVQHERYKQAVVRAGVPAEKLAVLGSARFCREWQEIYWKIVPIARTYRGKLGEDKLKVVHMDHHFRYRINVKDVLETARKLASLDFVDFVVKPSTGSREAMSSPKLYDVAKVDNETPSVELIRWADVVMCTTLSICLEILLQGKIFLYPKYFHQNEMLFDETGACFTVTSYAELEAILRRIASERHVALYPQEKVDAFLTEVVSGGVEDWDVLGDHEEKILAWAGSDDSLPKRAQAARLSES